ncbi:hypothetical protein [Paenibacillus humicola]|uniref:hypothetical protein n=1 Tax=Paenibacillus humicola TaxID=3110540 RepID=UPI00237B6DB9|nr:hypothetical protein [Paenibacillus humicola]
MFQWGKVVKNGIAATAVMEIFYRVSNLVVHHGIDVPYANGKSVALTSPFLIYLVGYVIDLIGGIAFSALYARFVRPKGYKSGMIFAVLFVWLIIDGFLFEPMGPAGILMLDSGFKAVAVNLFAHAVYGAVLGIMFRRDSLKAGGSLPVRGARISSL